MYRLREVAMALILSDERHYDIRERITRYAHALQDDYADLAVFAALRHIYS